MTRGKKADKPPEGLTVAQAIEKLKAMPQDRLLVICTRGEGARCAGSRAVFVERGRIEPAYIGKPKGVRMLDVVRVVGEHEKVVTL